MLQPRALTADELADLKGFFIGTYNEELHEGAVAAIYPAQLLKSDSTEPTKLIVLWDPNGGSQDPVKLIWDEEGLLKYM